MVLETKILGFHSIKTLYIEDEDFNKVVEDPSLYDSFTLQEGFLFKANKLCIPRSLPRDLIVKKAHGGVLAGHFGINKTFQILKEHFNWPKMDGNVHKVITRYTTCHMAKSRFYHGLYTPLLVPSRPWDDISMDFMVAFSWTPRGKDAIVVVVNRLSKMAHFIACYKCDDATYIIDIFFHCLLQM